VVTVAPVTIVPCKIRISPGTTAAKPSIKTRMLGASFVWLWFAVAWVRSRVRTP